MAAVMTAYLRDFPDASKWAANIMEGELFPVEVRMAHGFERDGVFLEYPDDWTLEEDTVENGWAVSLNSTSTPYLVLSYRDDVDDPMEMADAVLEGLRESFETLEADEAVETVGGQPAVGYDVHFFHLDLTNTAWIRALPFGAGSLLILAQTCDTELEDFEPLFQEMMAGMRLPD
ncbi:hypothetical protein [Zavarzinella formosa]|uniref:hypothetical protein n=1 Tax=Zavarzinella formosa TaxID=360055 RepID=UPI0002F5C15A|nr:hypothetical protein [Zavarzinella formosa]